MQSHRGMLSEDENDEEKEEENVNDKEKKRILNLIHDKHFNNIPEKLDWRDYGQY